MSADVHADPDVHAAGGVVCRTRRRVLRQQLEVLLVHRPRYDDWTFPKGKRDDDDHDDLATARREVEEETGFACVAGREISSTRYRDHRGRDKLVRYWLMDLPDGTTGDDFEPNSEVNALQWCRPAEAATLLTYEHDRVLLDHLRDPR